MKREVAIVIFFLCLLTQRSPAQFLNTDDASDLATMKTRATIDVESFIFYNESQFYSLRPGYFYGLRNERHVLGMSVPLVHTVFKGDYAGFENTTGFGDLKMTYLFVPYKIKELTGLTRVTVSIDVTAPTGEYKLGRGAGAWLYKPGLTLTMKPGPGIAFYPELRFQFSGGAANSQGGSDGTPDPYDPEKDSRVQNLSVSLPVIAQIIDWDGWFGLNALYTRSFTERTDYIFLRSDFGKMINENTAACLRITKFIAGQPRLNVVVQANVSFFIR